MAATRPWRGVGVPRRNNDWWIGSGVCVSHIDGEGVCGLYKPKKQRPPVMPAPLA